MIRRLLPHLPLLIILLLAAFLRFYQLNSHPAGFNADEAALGYNAYSLLLTGRDEHGLSWPLELRSFDDYKPPLYTYLLLPFIALFNLSPLVVRLPAALFGLLAVYLLYRLTRHLFPAFNFSLGRFSLSLGHLTAALLAISPWHLHFSRGAWEVNVATTLILAAIYLALLSLRRPWLFLPATLLAVLSLYTYHSARLLVPLLLFSFILIYFSRLRRLPLPPLIVSFLLGLTLTLPLLFQLTSGSAAARFSGVGLFSDPGPLAWFTNTAAPPPPLTPCSPNSATTATPLTPGSLPPTTWLTSPPIFSAKLVTPSPAPVSPVLAKLSPSSCRFSTLVSSSPSSLSLPRPATTTLPCCSS